MRLIRCLVLVPVVTLSCSQSPKPSQRQAVAGTCGALRSLFVEAGDCRNSAVGAADEASKAWAQHKERPADPADKAHSLAGQALAWCKAESRAHTRTGASVVPEAAAPGSKLAALQTRAAAIAGSQSGCDTFSPVATDAYAAEVVAPMKALFAKHDEEEKALVEACDGVVNGLAE